MESVYATPVAIPGSFVRLALRGEVPPGDLEEEEQVVDPHEVDPTRRGDERVVQPRRLLRRVGQERRRGRRGAKEGAEGRGLGERPRFARVWGEGWSGGRAEEEEEEEERGREGVLDMVELGVA